LRRVLDDHDIVANPLSDRRHRSRQPGEVNRHHSTGAP
jgi:hypothetical protein